jgi:molybdate transport system substrate-binding protein
VTSGLATVVTAIALVTAACSAGASTPTPAAGARLQVFAAASLKHALAALGPAWEAANPGSTLTISTDSSAALETKIEQGAPADVFLSADTANPQKLVDAGLATGAVTPFAGNALTIIVPAGNPAGIGSAADLATDGVKIIAAADGVPIQQYTTTLVDNLASVAGYPSDFAARYAANVVSREDNVAAIVAKIGLGEGDAGIVYATDAAATDAVETVEVPAEANVPATYGGVVIEASNAPDAARAFFAWLTGPDGQAILAGLGFLPPG